MTKTALNDLRPCWRCDEITLWRSRDGAIHCAQCSPPHAHYLIAQRLRAVPVPPSQLRRAMRFILLELKGAGSINARAVIDAATRARIAPATLTRAREELGLRSVKKPRGVDGIRQPHDQC
jgi:hypothetical protein